MPSHRRRALTLALAGHSARTVRVQITARTSAGRRLGTTRVYSPCSQTRLPSRLVTLLLKPVR